MKNEKCKIEDCNYLVLAKGLCKIHYNKQYYMSNCEAILLQKKEYSALHKKDKKEYDENYRAINKEKIAQEKHDYWIENIDNLRIYHRNYRNDRIKNDPLYKLRKSVSRSILKILKKNGSSKDGKSIKQYLSYSIDELRSHLESQFESWMTWDNHGSYDSKTWVDNDPSTWTWQIDHIIPHSRFKYTSMEDQEFKDCWALSNLRPLSAKQNLLKRDK